MIRLPFLTSGPFFLGAFTLLLFLSTPPLQARGDRLYVLPFRISGKPPASFFDEAELPTQAQQAAVFLARLVREYNTLAYRSPGEGADRAQGLDEEATRQRIPSLCAGQDATHLMGGRLLFTGKTDVTVEVFTASCAKRSILYRDHNSGHLNEIQALLRKGILRVTPFLPDSPDYARLQRLDDVRDRHTHIIVDASGSMELTLPFVRKGLEQLTPGPERKITITLVQSGGRLEQLGPFAERDLYLKTVRNLHGQGEIREKDLIDAMHRSRDVMVPGTDRLLLFTDQTLSEKALLDFQKELSDIRRGGLRVAYFPAYASDPGFLDRTGRFERLATVFEPVFARRAGYVTGESYFFVRRGAAYHLCPGSVGEEIASGRLDLKQCSPFPAFRYTKAELELDHLPEAYAKRNALTVSGISPVYSDLEFRIEDFLTEKTGARSPYRVLVQSGRSAFWIGMSRKSDFEALVSKKGQKTYVGLHLKQTPGGLENLPGRIHITADAPRLFLLEYDRVAGMFSEKNRLNVRDVWFFLVEVRDSRHD